ncbi:hypothetical protein [Acuticoccus yangtzensis]|uniref:hypothetical protein n=1 Tax=Acuticoccus yangtzensis TaxID=1443441 RepID=UPI0009496CD7|nr:hypothetical protein [Acuticoccus yangtzensis]
MRSIADTLPTLRSTGASPTPPPPSIMKENGRFNPLLLKKASALPNRRNAEAEGDDDRAGGLAAADEPSVAEIRRALLKRQGEAEGDEVPGTDGSAQTNGAAEPMAGAAPAAGAPGVGTPAVGGTSTDPAADPSRRAMARPATRSAAQVVPPFVTSASSAGGKMSIEAQIGAAVADARREAEAEKTAAVEFARKVERDVAARAVADARKKWCDEEGTAFAARTADAFDALHQKLSDAFGQALAPIAQAAIRDAAVRRFAAVLDDLVGPSAEGAAITVKGPAQLIDALRQASGDNGIAFEEVEGETELTVTVDETTLQTTIAAWADTLQRAIGGDDV